MVVTGTQTVAEERASGPHLLQIPALLLPLCTFGKLLNLSKPASLPVTGVHNSTYLPKCLRGLQEARMKRPLLGGWHTAAVAFIRLFVFLDKQQTNS